MTLHVHMFACLDDNYGALLHDSDTGATATVDAPDGAQVLAALDAKGWTLTDILVTHHHADHVQGIPILKARFPKARIVAPAKEAARIGTAAAPVDLKVSGGDSVRVGNAEAVVIETPGHTAGHIVYHFPEDNLLFAGDTLFSLGCGRVLETPMAVMWDSLSKLAQLPGDTQVYCGHEYTQSNAKFALGVEPGNALLVERAARVDALRAEGKPTLPTTIALELDTNPFLRAEEAAVQAAAGMKGADPAIVFAELRERKNRG